MKKILIPILFIFLFSNYSISQECLPEGIIFTYQAQIDQFPANYPNCDTILGIVGIIGDDIENLDSLSQIKFCGQRFHVQSCPNLININGLSNLEGTGGSFIIENCQSLNDLTGLESLARVGNDFMIMHNHYMKSLEGVSNLNYVGNNLVLHFMNSLVDLRGMENVERVDGGLVIWRLDSLLDISGFQNLDTINNSLAVKSCVALKNLDGLEGIQSINGKVHIFYNQELEDISALEELDFSQLDSLIIHYNPKLSNCHINNVCNLLDVNDSIVRISNNSLGCDTKLQVIDACNGIFAIENIANGISAIEIHPNPFSDKIEIDSDNEDLKDIQLLSLTGQLIPISWNNNSGKISVHISAKHPNGIYILRLFTAKGYQNIKLLKYDSTQ